MPFKKGETPKGAKPFTSESQPSGEKKSRKGIPNRSTVFKNLLSIKIDAKDIDGLKLSPFLAAQMGTGKLTLHQVAALGQVLAAVEGNTPAWKEIQDSLYGKIQDSLDVTSNGKDLIPEKFVIEVINGRQADKESSDK